MLFDLLIRYVGENAAPFVAIALFVIVVGVSLWLTPKIAKFVDARQNTSADFYGDIMEEPPEQAGEE